MRQIDAAALQVIDKPAGSGDENIHPARELTILHRIWRAAIDANRFQAQATSVLHSLSCHLLGKLARRRQYQHARAARRAMRRWNAWRHQRESL